MKKFSRSRRCGVVGACLAAVGLLIGNAGCDQLTETELRTIAAGSATTTTVTAVNTAFTSFFGELLKNALGDIFKEVFNVPPT
ncbi:hypothetical protein RAS1_36900 [Phycisphaerae bacterium RAS1]|nr:hypothetical protein RAS1_36900 [Phycisphaerae bacterium RAS1]